MARSIKVNQGVQIGDRQELASVTISASSHISISEDIPAEAADYQIDINLNCAACKLFYALATTNLEIQVNDAGSEETTLTLEANKPYLWHIDSGQLFAFGADVLTAVLTNATMTSLFVNEGLSQNGTLTIEALVDASPS